MSILKKLTKQIRIIAARIELAMCKSTLNQCVKNSDPWLLFDSEQQRGIAAAAIECLRARKKLEELEKQV